ncbi:MAG TPA: class I SAM-dependent methyltransferase [Candidatus Acidoferrales bacterium]|nr:class I SAM-dependent methyltransferase [Candidatus Acidoferrales bacterium]
MQPASNAETANRKKPAPARGDWLGGKAPDFETPTACPENLCQHDEWQSANRAWWESHPMRYDWKRPLPGDSGESAWYGEIDRRFFEAAVLPPSPDPFGALLRRQLVAGKSVLEVGVGMGSHAQILAEGARGFVGIDLSWPAVAGTRRRLELAGNRGQVVQMDVEKLAFPDGAFDLVWSWGVIHHSASTRRALEEIRRVLKPGGCALVMVYHRAFVPWFVHTGLIRGVLLGGLWRSRGIHALVQEFTDGAVARYYTAKEWRKEIEGLFEAEALEIYGNRGEILPLPSGRLKDAMTRCIPESFKHFWLTACRQGTLLFSALRPLETASPGLPADHLARQAASAR